MSIQSTLRPLVLLSIALLVQSGCGDSQRRTEEQDRRSFQNLPAEPDAHDATPSTPETDEERERFLDAAEAAATPEGRLILSTGRAMIARGDIVVGSCWTYIDALYTRAGAPTKNRQTIYRSKKAGPYVDAREIQPGDWLYYVNHSFGDVEHSGVFVGWTDFAQREALILSYPGQDLESPGRYRLYDLTSVYNIIRPKPGITAP